MARSMTNGSTTKHLLTFAAPMILGSIFQQLYNTTDAVIVGRIKGKDALAAVGVANPIMSIAIFFIFGLCVGASVLMAQYFGADDHEGFRVEVSTSLLAGLGFTLVVSVLCFFLTRPILILTRTPAAIIDQADAYLKVIFVGLIFSFLYNFYASTLRSIGDSRTPFLFLLLSSVLNIFLDIFFVATLQMDVIGVAIATVLAQAVSSLLCIVYVYKKIPLLKFGRNELVFDRQVLKTTVRYSWVSAIQQTFVYVGRLLVQGAVNPFGTSTIAAFNAASRIESFLMAPYEGVSTATSTFCAQNKGAGNYHRIKGAYRQGTLINASYAIVACILLFIFSPYVMRIFVNQGETDVIAIGSAYLKLMCPFYLVGSFTFIMQGLFRGVGLLKVTMVTTASQIILRVIFSYVLCPAMGVQGAGVATGIGWSFMFIFEAFCIRSYFKKLPDMLPNE